MKRPEPQTLQVSQNELQAMAYSDPLTGLGNRYRLRDKIRMLASERSSDPAPFTVGIANIDGFKPINDLFGVQAGDEILCQVAHRLKACIPDGAVVTRHDGDEFAFVLPLVFERTGAERIGNMIKDVLSAPYDLGDRNVRLSSSFGFAIYPFAGDDFEDLLKSAETALYRSKRRGRGQITVYSREIAQEMKRATQLEQALRNAIITDAIDVHSSPSSGWKRRKSSVSRPLPAGTTLISASYRPPFLCRWLKKEVLSTLFRKPCSGRRRKQPCSGRASFSCPSTCPPRS